MMMMIETAMTRNGKSVLVGKSAVDSPWKKEKKTFLLFYIDIGKDFN